MAINIFFFKMICLNLSEEREFQNFNLVHELNDLNNREKYGNRKIDVFKKSSSDNSKFDEKQNQNKDNLPNTEEVKVKNSFNMPEKI